jgi:formiminotetrahydrofolate cyclodeaminase|tara:strand:- start:2858 stop:3187 length:330 start_codon:yes stop_codon:yes gene_type:complete
MVDNMTDIKELNLISKMLNAEQGCGDHGCLFVSPENVVTDSQCRCVDNAASDRSRSVALKRALDVIHNMSRMIKDQREKISDMDMEITDLNEDAREQEDRIYELEENSI